jgi:hypothetical protein
MQEGHRSATQRRWRDLYAASAGRPAPGAAARPPLPRCRHAAAALPADGEGSGAPPPRRLLDRKAAYDYIDPLDLRRGARQQPHAAPAEPLQRAERAQRHAGAPERRHRAPPRRSKRDPTMAAILESRSLQQLSAALAANARYVLPTHLSAALNTLPKLRVAPHERPRLEQLLDTLLQDICGEMDALNSRSLASAVWAVARLKAGQQQASVEALLRELMGGRRAEVEGAPGLLSTLAWSLGQLQWQDQAVWEALLASSVQLLPSFSPLDCAQAAVGLARRRQQAQGQGPPAPPLRLEPALLAGIADRAAALLPDLTPQNTANLLWALATLHQPCPALCERVAERLGPEALPAFKPQELSSLAWGYARLVSGRAGRPRGSQRQRQGGAGSSGGSGGSGGSSSGDSSDGAPEELDWLDDATDSTTAAAVAALALSPSGAPAPAPSPSLGLDDAAARLASASHHQRFCVALAAQAAAVGPAQFKSEELVMLCWALAKLGRRHCPDELLDAIADAAIARRADLALKEMCCIAWALANLGHHRLDLLQALLPHALPMVGRVARPQPGAWQSQCCMQQALHSAAPPTPAGLCLIIEAVLPPCPCR